MARERQRVTQQAIADHLSVGQSAVSHWCTGRSEPDRETTSALADFLGVRAAWLLIGDGAMVDDAPVTPTPKPRAPKRTQKAVAEKAPAKKRASKVAKKRTKAVPTKSLDRRVRDDAPATVPAQPSKADASAKAAA